MAPGLEQSHENSPQSSDLWPHEEAARVADRVRAYPPERQVIFQSGFGPSGLPHLGTMCEVLRPSYVRHALAMREPNRASRLIVFIDDMDGLRKVPENIPNRELMQSHLGEPVSRIPDPFGCCQSFADHMLGLLREFLAPVEVDYELVRSSQMYSGGSFDEGLKIILAKHREIIAIVAPTLRPENRAGWSPIMPLCPNCGQIVERLVTAYHPERNTIEFTCERSAKAKQGCGFTGEQSVLGGLAKAQWKVDWALRWFTLKVDYELYGKDLTPSAQLSAPIVRIMGGNPPLGFPFEMFLDEQGHKVSKSVGRGVSVDQWQRYAPVEVLKFFLLQNPRRARKLFLESIPQYVDDYLEALREYAAAPNSESRAASPLEFVLQKDSAKSFRADVTFGMITNLVGDLGTSDFNLVMNYLRRYDPNVEGDHDTTQMVADLVARALNFYRDFIEPGKKAYVPTTAEAKQLQSLTDFLSANPDASAEEIEKTIYDLGRANYDKPGKIFPLMYRAILGQERGPRLGAYIRLLRPFRIVERLEAAIARST
ncbi:MAG: lysine--tRNA ligase [Candidatus Binataceae bacterium]